jgi:aryl-alcohol dehydrogenase-like predicted oxidoreductase
MKPMSGHGDPVKSGVLTAEEALRYAMSLPVATTISGIDKIEVLRQNLAIAQNFTPMNEAGMNALRERCIRYAGDGRFELYKVSMGSGSAHGA